MSSAHSMNAITGVHAQKLYPMYSQAFAHESSKKKKRSEEEETRQERQRPGGWLKEMKAAQQNKNTSEELKPGLPRHS